VLSKTRMHYNIYTYNKLTEVEYTYFTSCKEMYEGCRCLVKGLYSMRKLSNAHAEYIYLIVPCLKNFQRFPER
jgi:hypothetical protein